jgi:hypothetical protein
VKRRTEQRGRELAGAPDVAEAATKRGVAPYIAARRMSRRTM